MKSARMLDSSLYELYKHLRGRPVSRSRNSPLWCENEYIYNQSTFNVLHNEIFDFAKWILPTPEEKHLRLLVVKRFRSAVSLLWPGAKLVCTGSTATDSYLPDGDIDLVIYGAPQDADIGDLLEDLNRHLINLQLVSRSKVLSHAKCPIIDVIEKPFGFNMDIAVNNVNGILNVSRHLSEMKRYPVLLPLLMVLKVFLKEHRMNEPYSGGISSNTLFQLVLMIVQSNPSEKCMGKLINNFFQTYGNTFNFFTTGISTRNGGRLFSRVDTDHMSWMQSVNICIEDPQNPGNFLGENSYDTLGFRRICYKSRQNLYDSNSQNSLLSRILSDCTYFLDRRKELQKHYDSLNRQVKDGFSLEKPREHSRKPEPQRYKNK